jgi:hypothetical protein
MKIERLEELVKSIIKSRMPMDDKLWILSELLWTISPYTAMRISRLFALLVSDLWDCHDTVYQYLMTGDNCIKELSWQISYDFNIMFYRDDLFYYASSAAIWASAEGSIALLESIRSAIKAFNIKHGVDWDFVLITLLSGFGFTLKGR